MKEIYNKMKSENIPYSKMCELIEPKMSAANLRLRMLKFCEENGLEKPKSKTGIVPTKITLKK